MVHKTLPGCVYISPLAPSQSGSFLKTPHETFIEIFDCHFFAGNDRLAADRPFPTH
jgi:hypothetical protein